MTRDHRPGNPIGTAGPVDLPGPEATFAALDDRVPVLFAPVRIETRFTAAGTGQTRRLRVRIYPDQFHLDDHDPRLTEREAAVGRAYWRAVSADQAPSDPAGRAAARDWLVAQLPARRAAWVARQTRPGRRAPSAGGPARAPRARCLPERWAVIGYTRTSGSLAPVFTAWSAPVRADLTLGVDLDRYGANAAPGELPVDDGMRWMTDYDEAVGAGMAVTVDLAGYPEVARSGLALLLVVGVSGAGPADAAGSLAALLEAHQYADGLAFIPQGTPTNNTDQVRSGWSAREPDAGALLDRELDSDAPALPAGSNGVRAARALGIPGDGLFPRLENARDDEETPQAAMNRVLWPVTWGQYFDHLLAGVHTGSVMPPSAVADFEHRFLADVRGGAPLPTLRVGAQPYGLLPVRYSQPAQQWVDQSPWYEYALHFFRRYWLDTAGTVVPRMDPVLGASGGSASNQPDSVLGEILANLPHPGRFLVRELRSWRTTDTEDIDDFGEVIIAALLPFLYFDDPTFGYEALSVLGRWGWALEILGGADYLAMPASALSPLDDPALAGADAQIAELNRLRGRVDSLLPADDREGARAWIDSMITLVEQHKARQSPLLELAGPTLDFAGVIADEVDDPTIFYSVYARDEDTTIFDLPLVRSPAASTGRYLAALRDRVPELRLDPAPDPGHTLRSVPMANRPLPPEFLAARPLLYQLLDGVVEAIPRLEATAYRQALDDLAAESDERLELRLRETLGLASHRLDAYFTAMARRRLDELRGTRLGAGVQLGAYGWVVDLVPDAAGALASQGFIHAPSIQQATTAAILRSGWSAHGSSQDTSAMALDLSGRRVRLAAWLLDGVRQGQGLGELLGYRFERGLHEAGLSAWIDPVRRAVLLAAGVDRAPRGPVDGLDLIDLYAQRTTPQALLAPVPAEYLPPGPPAVLGPSLDAAAAALDATGDAAIAESVHQVAQGNMTRAAATLDAINQGEVAPPELTSLATPPSGDSITHRVVLLLGTGDRTEGWATKAARATADPALEAWAGSVLGPATAIAAQVRWADGTGGTTGWQPVTMAELGLAALDAVFDAPPLDPTAQSRWGRRIEAAVRARMPATDLQPASIEIDFAAAPAGGLSMADAAELARQLRSLIGGCRPLTAADLAAPGAGTGGEEMLAEAEARVHAVEAGFRSRARTLLALLPSDLVSDDTPHPVGDASPEAVRDAMRALTGYPLPGAAPVAGYRGDTADIAALWDAAWTLGEQVNRRLARLDGVADRTGARRRARRPADGSGSAARLLRTWQAVLGRGYPLIVRVVPAEGGPLDGAALARGDDLAGADQPAVAEFVTQLGRVRPGVRRLDDLALVGELLHNRSVVNWAVAQLPDVPGDPWVATGRPVADTGGRVHWLAADQRAPDAAPGDGVAGLFVDGWVERIPGRTQTTGVALHFDAPAARPPQSLLLAVTPDDATPWSLDLVVATLMQVLEDAQLRAVSPQLLSEFGHHLPVIFSPGPVTGAASTGGSAS